MVVRSQPHTVTLTLTANTSALPPAPSASLAHEEIRTLNFALPCLQC